VRCQMAAPHQSARGGSRNVYSTCLYRYGKDFFGVCGRYTLSRQGHKAAPMRLISPDEVAELVPILNMNNVSTVDWYLLEAVTYCYSF
jgi:hypothetical protein